jgi:ABC-type ATPase involved in cell division
MDIAVELKNQGTTLIIASHDALVHESTLADRRIVVRDGLLVDPDMEQ